MKVLQVNSSDIIGSRFNGFDIRGLLANQGIRSHHLVWNKISNEAVSSRFFDVPGSRFAMQVLARVERFFSIHSRLQWQSFLLPLHREFREADVVHYHILHDGYFSLDALPLLSRLKPTVWTLHDQWPLTGHCIYPLGCERWRSGCGACPRLDIPFMMHRDRTAQDFNWKRGILRRMKVDLVVASDSMRRMAERSPVARDKPLHVIPFGINLQKFVPGDTAAARERLGILPNRIVIGVRSFPKSPYKGFDHFVSALRRLTAIGVPLAIVTTHTPGQLNEFIGRHQIIDLGWINNEDLMLDTYRAADLFVMPSVTEAFGMMAIEAMACGKPVIIFDGTSLPDITRAPTVGLAVPNGNDEALASAIRFLAENKDERLRRGVAGRALAEQLYDERVFARRLSELYGSIVSGRTEQADRRE
jgi:glycosyltransferase involved in cell wall biosynthesis